MTASTDIALTLDLAGLKCPYPVLRTRRALAGLAVGARLKVLATDPMAALDLKHFCQEDGHVMEAETTCGDTFVFIIRRGRP